MKLIVGISDMMVSNNPDEEIITYSLGSCIGITIYDPHVNVAGLLHYMLPDSELDKEKSRNNPYMFADTGIPLLFKSAYALGAQKHHMTINVFGGAQVFDQQGFFNIGKRNYLALRKLFFKNNVIINFEEVGGNINRTIRIFVESGDVYMKTSEQKERKI